MNSFIPFQYSATFTENSSAQWTDHLSNPSRNGRTGPLSLKKVQPKKGRRINSKYFVKKTIKQTIHTYAYMLSRAKLLQSCPTLCNSHQAPLSMGFSRQEYHSGLPCPPPGDLPDPEIQPASLRSSELAGGSLPLAPPGKPSASP